MFFYNRSDHFIDFLYYQLLMFSKKIYQKIIKSIRIPIRDLFLFSFSENNLFLTIFSSFSMERIIEIKIFARLSFEQSGSNTFSIENNWSIGERRDCLVVLYIHCRYHIKRKNPITYKKRSKTMTRE